MRNYVFKKAVPHLGVVLLALILGSCLQTEPRDLRKGGNTKPSPADSGNLESFRVNFASTSVLASTNPVFIQGAANTGSAFVTTCNASGTNCECDFYNGATLVGTASGAAAVAYDTQGNFVRCIPPNAAAKTTVVLRNLVGTKTTGNVTITLDSALTVTQLLGSLSLSKVRVISRYACALNFFQKNFTTANTFDCSSQTGGLRFITGQFNYYLFADGLNSNFANRATDLLYGGGFICSLQVRQVDCVTTASSQPTPTAEFGIYSEATGPFSVPVSLNTSPSFTAGTQQLYGYAAPVSAFAGGSCPPGMQRMDLYTANMAAGAAYVDAATCNGACTSDNNIIAYQDIRVGTFGVPPAGLAITRKAGSGATGSMNITINDDTTYGGGDNFSIGIVGTPQTFNQGVACNTVGNVLITGTSDPSAVATCLALIINTNYVGSGYSAVAGGATVTINGPSFTYSETDAGTNNFSASIVSSVGNGDCDGSLCSSPGGASAAYGIQPAYAASGGSGFCVIPTTTAGFPN